MPPRKQATRRKATKTTRSSKSTKSSKSASTGGRRRKVKSPLNGEILSISLIAVGVFFIVAIYFSSGGFLGEFFRNIIVGLFGFGAYILPVFVMGLAIYSITKKVILSFVKNCFLFLLFLCIISFAFLINGDKLPYSGTFFGYINNYYATASVSNGGVFGSIFGNALMVILGTAGAYIFLCTGIVITIMVVSGQSIVSFVENVVEKVKEVNYYEDEYYDDNDDEYYEDEYYDDEDEYYDEEEYEEKPRKEKGKAPIIKGIGEEDGKKARKNKNNDELVETPNKKGNKRDFEGQMTLEEDNISEEEQIEKFSNEIFVNTKKNPLQHLYEEDAITDTPPEGLSIKEYKIAKSSEKKPVFINYSVDYEVPPITYLNENPASNTPGSRAQILENSRKLEETLKSFGVEAKVIEVSKGPTVTRYELAPGVGVKVSKISGLADDLALNLAAAGIRIEAPIPGKAAVGIEVPNKEVTPVFLREVLEDEHFINFASKLAFGLGKDIAGNTVVADIAKMPHLLIAGATGSGKSVCINTLVTSIIYKATPNEVKLLMIDPKVVELSIYNGIPHLLIPVVTEPKKAASALNWAVNEMVNRYNLFAQTNVRDLKGYNEQIKEAGEGNLLPQIVIIIDELADLMMAAASEVEDCICRLAQMARAAGLHLIIATQRPSVDVITGLIKANIPSRLAFSVSSGTDSRTVLDMTGAEKLMGKGDMLFFPVGMAKPLRVQGAFISDKEVEHIVNFIKKDAPLEYDQEMIDKITAAKSLSESDDSFDDDEFFIPAVDFLVQKEKASASLLQRQFRIGYNRASRLIEILETKGIVGPEDGSKPRKVLISSSTWAQIKQNRQEK